MDINIQYRKQWLSLLKKNIKKNNFFQKTNLDSNSVCRRLEEFAHRNRQQIKYVNDIPIYQYGEKQILFEDAEAHIEASTNQYLQNIQKILYICAEGNIENVRYENPEDWINNEKIFEGTEHDAWEKLYFARQEMAKNVLANKEMVKGLFSCPKCKSFDVDTDQKQTRSADEPMTIFCSCNACGKRFIR